MRGSKSTNHIAAAVVFLGGYNYSIGCHCLSYWRWLCFCFLRVHLKEVVVVMKVHAAFKVKADEGNKEGAIR